MFSFLNKKIQCINVVNPRFIEIHFVNEDNLDVVDFITLQAIPGETRPEHDDEFFIYHDYQNYCDLYVGLHFTEVNFGVEYQASDRMLEYKITLTANNGRIFKFSERYMLAEPCEQKISVNETQIDLGNVELFYHTEM
jgi:hypothetical protein